MTMIKPLAPRYLHFLYIPLIVSMGMNAAAAETAAAEADETPKVSKLAIQPMSAPRPALKYRLLPQYLDQTPGNAAQLYHMAIELKSQQGKTEDADQTKSWLDLPVDQLPREKAHELLNRNAASLREVRLAARREYCHWDLPMRVEGIQTLLPFLGEYRTLARLVALEARLAMIEGRFDDAAGSLQTGYAMAAHVCRDPLLITSLVGTAIGSLMTQQLEVWVARPGAPNLYWALSGLPKPFVDLGKPLEGETALVYLELPELAHIEEVMSPQAAGRISAQLEKLTTEGSRENPDWSAKLGAAVMAAGQYADAKRRLIESGRKPEIVEAMPLLQVVLLDALDWYAYRRDETFKWQALPYWQAQPHVRELERLLEEDLKGKRGLPFLRFMPSVQRACFTTRLLDRRIDALRCVEAIRMHAAANQGQLPGSLGAISVIPLPLDPITGKEFDYRLAGDTATLSALSPPGERAGQGFEYVITIRKN